MEIAQWIIDYPLKALIAAIVIVMLSATLCGLITQWHSLHKEFRKLKEVKHVRKEINK